MREASRQYWWIEPTRWWIEPTRWSGGFHHQEKSHEYGRFQYTALDTTMQPHMVMYQIDRLPISRLLALCQDLDLIWSFRSNNGSWLVTNSFQQPLKPMEPLVAKAFAQGAILAAMKYDYQKITDLLQT